MYNPEVGRFLSQDPLGPGVDPNQYRYVRNTPPNLIDPNGQHPIAWIIGGGAVVISAAWWYAIQEWGTDYLTSAEQDYLDALLKAMHEGCNEVGTAEAKKIAERLGKLWIGGKYEKSKERDDSESNSVVGDWRTNWYWFTYLRANFFETDVESQCRTLCHESWHVAETDETEMHTDAYAFKCWDILKKTAAIERFKANHTNPRK